MVFDQSEYNVRCEWGEHGVQVLAPISDVVIIVDVLSFSTAVEIAVSQSATVFPYRWRDATCYEYARSLDAEVADKDNPKGYSLSPSSLLNLPPKVRLVLPSPNGSTLSLLADGTQTLLGCFRNCRAVAESAMKKGRNIALIPAGERWGDDSLRPCFEDLAGAGAIIHFLRGTLSPEALAARNVFEESRPNLYEQLRGCSSGKEKICRGEGRDVELAAELNVSRSVPFLSEGSFVRET
ncbi:MAG TPA: 2-phosphosulfolactate phosphatase [Pyrinomonadaceae bacterium]|nr:2-phosphosulfolactate phosphatase [Pyrinomonadaceae bacterium]